VNEDTNKIIRNYLAGQTTLTDIVDDRIYCPRLPEGATLPAVGFFTRGGSSTPYIPGLVTPSVQFDCWAENVEVAGVETRGDITARQVYRALYDVLQGIQNQAVVVDGTTYYIESAIEEVQGQDLQDVDVPTYFRVLAQFSIMIKAE